MSSQRGLTPFVVLGFFPAGVYTNTAGGLPTDTPPSFGPDADYIAANPGDWPVIMGNWSTLIEAFFKALLNTFGNAIESWWFEVWNEPDNSAFWAPDIQNANPLSYYLELYQATVTAINTAVPNIQVKVGGPAIMASQYILDPSGSQSDLQFGIPIFLDFVYGNTLQCDFISLHEKGDWEVALLPSLPQVINSIESIASSYASAAKYNGYFNNKPIVNDEADMRVLAAVPFYPRMNSQFAAWLTALMIAHDSLTSEYASQGGAQFMGGSDNAHLELVAWQQPNPNAPSQGQTLQPSGGALGNYGFGQQRSIMTAASPWQAGAENAPVCPQDLVKLPVYNFYELLRLLGDQHGVFISGQQNFYPTQPSSDLFSAITVGAPGGKLTHVCWVFCVYPTIAAANADPAPPPPVPQSWSFPVEVIDLPAAWKSINWVQFQIGPPQTSDSFIVAQTGQQEAKPPLPITEVGGAWLYDISVDPIAVNLADHSFSARNVRNAQELGVVECVQNFPMASGVWKSPAPISFAPYTSTAFWITPYDPAAPATPIAASYSLPNGTSVAIPIAIRIEGNVIIRWHYPVTDPLYNAFFYFAVYRGGERGTGTLVSPIPINNNKDGRPTPSFALRAARCVDTAPPSGSTYYIYAVSASGVFSSYLNSSAV